MEVISSEKTRPVHLFVALSAAAYCAAFLVTLAMGIGEFDQDPGGFLLLPLESLALTIFTLPIAIVVGVPGYFYLRRRGQISASLFLTFGALPGIVLLVVNAFEPKLGNILFASACTLIGAASAYAAFVALRVLASKTSGAG